jgi:hypothetical protein
MSLASLVPTSTGVPRHNNNNSTEGFDLPESRKITRSKWVRRWFGRPRSPSLFRREQHCPRPLLSFFLSFSIFFSQISILDLTQTKIKMTAMEKRRQWGTLGLIEACERGGPEFSPRWRLWRDGATKGKARSSRKVRVRWRLARGGTNGAVGPLCAAVDEVAREHDLRDVRARSCQTARGRNGSERWVIGKEREERSGSLNP